MNNRKYKLVIAGLAVALAVAVASAVILYSVSVSMTFSIKKEYRLGLYQDSACTIPLTNVNWEFDSSDEILEGYYIQYVLAYLKNEANMPVTVTWNLTSSSWQWNSNWYVTNGTIAGWYRFLIDNPVGTGWRISQSRTIQPNEVLEIALVGETRIDNPADPLVPVSATLHINAEPV